MYYKVITIIICLHIFPLKLIYSQDNITEIIENITELTNTSELHNNTTEHIHNEEEHKSEEGNKANNEGVTHQLHTNTSDEFNETEITTIITGTTSRISTPITHSNESTNSAIKYITNSLLSNICIVLFSILTL
ncbi:hypothetical protein MN116_007982 [Schistosoma mekongi]|uniref:Uncharacterized protein n=1 Tax=Schistosoma mekongi TaxID=38744 RepID=A0AAE1Z7K8_SCHME|nr:hypothetical protein MN116_007982 [Schistosoma mekongi]